VNVDIINDTSVSTMVESYRSGNRDFNTHELRDIKLYLLKYKDCIEQATFYSGKIKTHNVISCFADSFYKELADYGFKKYSADIVIIVSVLTRELTMFYIKDRCTIDILKLAAIFCAANTITHTTTSVTGKFTANFLNFTKILNICT